MVAVTVTGVTTVLGVTKLLVCGTGATAGAGVGVARAAISGETSTAMATLATLLFVFGPKYNNEHGSIMHGFEYKSISEDR